MALVPKTEEIVDGSTYIGYRDPLTGFLSGAPLSAPVTPALTGDNDRYIGNDSAGSHIALNITPFLHQENWKCWFYSNSVNMLDSSWIYTEGSTTTDNLIYTIGNNSSGQLQLRARDSANNVIYDIVSSEAIFDSIDNQLIQIERSGTTITLKVNRVASPLVGSPPAGSYEPAETSTIGALIRTGVLGGTSGVLWDFNLDGTIIPINEGTGTDIKDASGTSVGTLTDPSGTFWDYSVATWTLVSDNPCGDNLLLLDDNKIALQDDLGAFLFEG